MKSTFYKYNLRAFTLQKLLILKKVFTVYSSISVDKDSLENVYYVYHTQTYNFTV